MRPQKKRILKRRVKQPRKHEEDSSPGPQGTTNASVREAFKKRQTLIAVIAGACLLGVYILQQIPYYNWGIGAGVAVALLFIIRVAVPIVSRNALHRCPKCETQLKRKWYNMSSQTWHRCPHCGTRLS